MKESKLQHEIRKSLAERRDSVWWRNQVGQAVYYRGGTTCSRCKQPTLNARKFVVPYGLSKGSSDLIGIVPVNLRTVIGGMHTDATLGVFAGLELKTKRGRETEEQKLFRSLVNKQGGAIKVVRSVEEAHQHINDIKELRIWTQP